MKYELIKGDCLEKLKNIKDGSVDLILTDPPYGTIKGAKMPDGWDDESVTQWDNRIDTTLLFKEYERVLRNKGRLILFAQQPFTTELIKNSNSKIKFSQVAIWLKSQAANILGCKHQLTNLTEDIVIFTKNLSYDEFNFKHPLRPYFKKVLNYIGLNYGKINKILGHTHAQHTFHVDTLQFALCTEETYNELIKHFNIDKMEGFISYDKLKEVDNNFKEENKKRILENREISTFNLWDGSKQKNNVFKYSKESKRYHPTQKPVALLEDLIKIYSNEGDTVLDSCMGSGSTGIACINTNRNFIGIELDENFYNIAKERVDTHYLNLKNVV